MYLQQRPPPDYEHIVCHAISEQLISRREYALACYVTTMADAMCGVCYELKGEAHDTESVGTTSVESMDSALNCYRSHSDPIYRNLSRNVLGHSHCLDTIIVEKIITDGAEGV